MQNEPPPADLPEHNPFESPEKAAPLRPIPKPSVLAMIGIAMAVLASSAIAFCCTCIPIGIFTFELHPTKRPANEEGIDWYVVCQFLPWIGGLVAAILVGYWVRRSLWSRAKK